MKHISKTIGTLLVCLMTFGGAAYAASADNQPKTLIIIADLQESEAMGNEAYVKRLADTLTGEVQTIGLNFGDTIKLRTASGASLGGEPDDWNRAITLSYKGAKPEDLTGFLQKRMGEIPTLPKSQDSGLLWTLDEVGSQSDCTNAKAYVVIVGTAVQLFEEVNGQITMQGLPGQPFAGCEKILWLGLAAKGSIDTIEKKNAILSIAEQFSLALGVKHVDFAN